MTKRIMLTAAEGKILTNGEIYGSTIYLAEGADEASFREIPVEEYEAIQAEESRASMGMIGEGLERIGE